VQRRDLHSTRCEKQSTRLCLILFVVAKLRETKATEEKYAPSIYDPIAFIFHYVDKNEPSVGNPTNGMFFYRCDQPEDRGRLL
jgi:hypothetical protein